MPDYFRAVALDFDGTLTTGERPSREVLAALSEARSCGRRLVLVTGRTLRHLRSGFADVDTWFDAVVAENGAVLHTPVGSQVLARPVDPALADALTGHGVAVDRGQVILGCSASHDHLVLEEVRRLGADYQLTRNRGALMIVPAGVTKRTGLDAALDHLGLSPHSTIAIGDAENDQTMLEHCEVGVAVANAVDSLKRRADIVTTAPDGGGVIEILRGDVLRGGRHVHPDRWQIPLGTYLDGTPAAVPASQVNMLVTGGTQAGKSYLAGLIAERLIQLAYAVVVIDVEGDHTQLAELPDVVHLGGHEPVPTTGLLRNLLSHHGTSIVADLSQLTGDERRAWYQETPPRLADLRSDRGLPHWVLVDEAHESLGHASETRHLFSPDRKGHIMVTYHPTDLCAEARTSIDLLIALRPSTLDAEDPVVVATTTFSRSRVDEVLDAFTALPAGAGLLMRASEPGVLRPFRLGSRLTTHVRHWHKYATVDLPAHQRFVFRRNAEATYGKAAASLPEFHRELARCEPDVIAHHAGDRDFSRWIRGVFRDDRLAAEVEQVEAELTTALQENVATARRRLLAAVELRYPV
nr:HAD hydrolase family protein [Propionibacterium sp.]